MLASTAATFKPPLASANRLEWCTTPIHIVSYGNAYAATCPAIDLYKVHRLTHLLEIDLNGGGMSSEDSEQIMLVKDQKGIVMELLPFFFGVGVPWIDGARVAPLDALAGQRVALKDLVEVCQKIFDRSDDEELSQIDGRKVALAISDPEPGREQ